MFALSPHFSGSSRLYLACFSLPVWDPTVSNPLRKLDGIPGMQRLFQRCSIVLTLSLFQSKSRRYLRLVKFSWQRQTAQFSRSFSAVRAKSWANHVYNSANLCIATPFLLTIDTFPLKAFLSAVIAKYRCFRSPAVPVCRMELGLCTRAEFRGSMPSNRCKSITLPVIFPHFLCNNNRASARDWRSRGEIERCRRVASEISSAWNASSSQTAVLPPPSEGWLRFAVQLTIAGQSQSAQV